MSLAPVVAAPQSNVSSRFGASGCEGQRGDHEWPMVGMILPQMFRAGNIRPDFSATRSPLGACIQKTLEQHGHALVRLCSTRVRPLWGGRLLAAERRSALAATSGERHGALQTEQPPAPLRPPRPVLFPVRLCLG